MALSPDGKALAAASKGNCFVFAVWGVEKDGMVDVSLGEMLRAHTDLVYSMAWVLTADSWLLPPGHAIVKKPIGSDRP